MMFAALFVPAAVDPRRALLFGSVAKETPTATPTVGATPAPESTCWEPVASPSTCTAGVDTSPYCPYDSIGDITVCPEPFPEWSAAARRLEGEYEGSTTTDALTCELAVVGAGPGGLYTALRLVDTGTVAASDICIFEMSGRVGGRIYSLRGFGPDADLVVDVGAYRSWPEYTPITHALITEYLGLPVHCYDPGDDPCTKFNIAAEEGSERKAGFATFVEVMMSRLVDAGARWFPHYELLSVAQSSAASAKQLTFSNGAQAVASKVVLNMPQRPLLKVLRASSLPTGALDADSGVFESVHTVATAIVAKVYLYYSDAWWLNDLGLDTGEFELEGDATEMVLKGRYHDGDVKCDSDGKNCHGFLQATYAHDYAGFTSMYLRRYQNDRDSPATIIGNADAEGAAFLQHAHDRVVHYHKYVGGGLDDRYTPFQVRNLEKDTSPPEFAVVASWNIATPGAGAGWHSWTNLDRTEIALDPLGEYGIHVVNEAFSFVQGWAEGSLQQADAVLDAHFGVSHPWGARDMASELSRVVADTSISSLCGEDEEHGTASDGGGGGGGGSATDDEDPLCFTGAARLQLANGSLVPLRDARAGDLVWTGDGVGLVTAALAHELGGVMDVAVLPTEHGELVGTRSHPIRVGAGEGAWREIGAAHAEGLLPGATFEKRFVQTLYNLEVDGGAPGASAHAYVVNGVVASGLGDNEELNLRFPRQQSWKARRARQDEAARQAEAAAAGATGPRRQTTGPSECPATILRA